MSAPQNPLGTGPRHSSRVLLVSFTGGSGPDFGNDNPYGGTPPPPPPPGGANPYGGAAWSERPEAPLDGVSIASLVTAVLCCTGPVAIVLGIIGIVRTKAGERRGRWMAVVGLVVGTLATLALIAVVVFAVWFGNQVVTPAGAERGQCVDVQAEGETVLLLERDCEETHDAEVVYAGEYDAATDPSGPLTAAICLDRLSSGDITALQQAGVEPTDIDVITTDPEDMADGDPYACYVHPEERLTEPLL